jgi:hypothetical protein
VKEVPAGVVPACLAGFVFSLYFSEYCALSMCCVVLVFVFSGLKGYVPIPLAIGREELTWIFYTMLLLVTLVPFRYPDRQMLAAYLLVVLFGLLLDHPVFVALGWLGVFMGTGSLLILIVTWSPHHSDTGFVPLIVFSIASLGCFTLGFHMPTLKRYASLGGKLLRASLHRRRPGTREACGDTMTSGLLSTNASN